jgi:hypothetical protein
MREIARREQAELGASVSPNLRSVLAVASLDKDDPDAALTQSAGVAASGPLTRIQHALMLIWVGQRKAGVQELEKAQATPQGKQLATRILESLS